MPALNVVIVNFRSAELVGRLLGSLRGEAIKAALIFDNGGDQADRLRPILEQHPWARLCSSASNVGFGAGVNRAVELLAPDSSELLWILNPDIVVLPQAVTRLTSALREDRADIVSPLILSPARDDRIWFAGGSVDWRFGRVVHDRWGEPAERAGDRLIETEFITGAAPMMRAEIWRSLGGFREDYFLYYEDTDLSVRARRAGLRMAVVPTARVRHDEGGSSAQRGRGAAYYEYSARNRRRFFSEHAAGENRLRRLLQEVETGRLVLRALREPVGRLTKARAALRAARVDRRQSPTASPNVRPGLRVIPELRAAHLEELESVAPRRLVFFRTNYDMAGVIPPPHAKRVTLAGACWEILRQPDGALELFEPLWIEHFFSWVVLAGLWRLTRFGRPRARRACYFAIENNELRRKLSRGRSWLQPLAVVAEPPARTAVRVLTGRCVFGSPQASDTYGTIFRRKLPPHQIILDLPTAAASSNGRAPQAHAIFVGALEERKGIPRLMAAWEAVERNDTNARLTIVGDGPLSRQVDDWIQQAPQSRCWKGLQPRDTIADLLSGSSILIAPSIRLGGWREQIGRPIREALSQGLTVVTTSETGLADYLRSTGHHVLPSEKITSALLPAILEALHTPLPRAQVRSSLPDVDGRFAADAWLHG